VLIALKRGIAPAVVASLLCASSVGAQIAADGPVVYGHHHLIVTNIDAHKKFWIDTLGGTPARLGTSAVNVIALPNVLIVLTPGRPAGGTKGTTVNHIGFAVPDLRAALDRIRNNGFPIVTRAELPAQWEVKDDIGLVPDTKASVAFVMAPDETKVEFVEVKTMKGRIALHHVHFAAPDVTAMRDWYVKTFGAKPGMRGSFVAADLPGVNLTFSPAPAPVVGTRGRTLDHIGFEIRNLESFVRTSESSGAKVDRAYTKAAQYGDLGISFLTDPWGTYIELNEGLTAVK
jgi:catechol 2,3-dioxygenase-like lactoylglutathione lyase family enzyme